MDTTDFIYWPYGSYASYFNGEGFEGLGLKVLYIPPSPHNLYPVHMYQVLP
jgi:hypothetical protein